MRDYKLETEKRVAFLREKLADSGCKGFVFGNSGGKDSALVGILCKMACENTLGVLLPCATTQNYGSDTDDALRLAEQFGIESRTVDLTAVREAETAALAASGTELNNSAVSNIAPRLRMTTLYAIAAAESRLVVGTGNRSEIYLGYFTKWGDGAADVNPIADLSVTEIFEFLEKFRAAAPTTPVVLVPTSFNSVKEEEWKARGANIIIYANQLMRAAVPAIRKAAETILENHRAEECDAQLMPFKDIIRLIPEE